MVNPSNFSNIQSPSAASRAASPQDQLMSEAPLSTVPAITNATATIASFANSLGGSLSNKRTRDEAMSTTDLPKSEIDDTIDYGYGYGDDARSTFDYTAERNDTGKRRRRGTVIDSNNSEDAQQKLSNRIQPLRQSRIPSGPITTTDISALSSMLANKSVVSPPPEAKQAPNG